MSSFPVTTASRSAGAAFSKRFEMFRNRVCSLYNENEVPAAQGLELECALFLNWCVEIAGRNAQPSCLDRWRAKLVFQRNLQSSLRPFSENGCESLQQLKERYRSRYRDALGTMWNIYLQRDKAGKLHAPTTRRTSRLFLRHSTDIPKGHTSIIISGIHEVLSETLTQYAEDFYWRDEERY